MISLALGLFKLLLLIGAIGIAAMFTMVLLVLLKGPRLFMRGGIRRKLAWIALIVAAFKIWDHFKSRRAGSSGRRPPLTHW